MKNTLYLKISRISIFLGDFFLLLQIIALAALVAWQLNYTPDIVGFMIIGGEVGGFLSIYIFVILAIIAFRHNAELFWHTVHPLNIALAMMIWALYYGIVLSRVDTVSTALLIGIVMAISCLFFLPQKPKLWIVLCLAMFLLRFLIPWAYRYITAAAIGIFVLTLWIKYKCFTIWSEETTSKQINDNE